MTPRTVKFNKNTQPEFFKELRKRVNNHFRTNNISQHANSTMVFKTIFMCCLYFIPLFILISGTVTQASTMFLCWVIMGFGMSGIGLSVMHDANHGSYSKNPTINASLGFLINFLGGYHVNWKIQHNVLHHSYTNIEGLDDDIAKTQVFRMSPHQEQKRFYKYQAFYAPFIYSIMSIYWLLGKDFDQIKRYHQDDLLETQGLGFKEALTSLLFHKTWYVVLTIILPIVMVAVPWWQILIGFMIMHFICGLALALIFQTAHVLEETNFFRPTEHGSMENNWAIHQMMTTSNYAHKSRLFSWFIGGLNFQIEHHLFPNICHVHYRDISDIVKSTAKEYNIPYYQHTTFFQALKSHFSHLNEMGRSAMVA